MAWELRSDPRGPVIERGVRLRGSQILVVAGKDARMNKTLKGNCGNKAKEYVDFQTAEISRPSARR